MKQLKKVLPFTGAAMLALTAIVTPYSVQASGVSSSASLASMYLWRGQDISNQKPALSGDITYSHDSGAYASLWISSEGASGSYESDWTIGYSGSAGDMGYDVGYYKFWYPEMDDGGHPQTFADAGAEVYLGLTYKDFGFKAFLDAKGDKTYKYYTLSYSYGVFSALVGISDDDDNDADYKHLDISYAATDRLSFTVSKPIARGSSGAIEFAPLMMLSYSIPVDLK